MVFFVSLKVELPVISDAMVLIWRNCNDPCGWWSICHIDTVNEPSEITISRSEQLEITDKTLLKKRSGNPILVIFCVSFCSLRASYIIWLHGYHAMWYLYWTHYYSGIPLNVSPNVSPKWQWEQRSARVWLRTFVIVSGAYFANPIYYTLYKRCTHVKPAFQFILFQWHGVCYDTFFKYQHTQSVLFITSFHLLFLFPESRSLWRSKAFSGICAETKSRSATATPEKTCRQTYCQQT